MQPIVWLNIAPVYVIKGKAMNSVYKTEVRVERFDNLEFVARFEYGVMAEESGIGAGAFRYPSVKLARK